MIYYSCANDPRVVIQVQALLAKMPASKERQDRIEKLGGLWNRKLDFWRSLQNKDPSPIF
jgi:hypothetical protein